MTNRCSPCVHFNIHFERVGFEIIHGVWKCPLFYAAGCTSIMMGSSAFTDRSVEHMSSNDLVKFHGLRKNPFSGRVGIRVSEQGLRREGRSQVSSRMR